MIKIKFKNKDYNINKKFLIEILSYLNNGEIKEKEIKKLIKKYKLYNELFLKNIIKIQKTLR